MGVWLRAIRPKTLMASVAPVLMGTAMAYSAHRSHWPAALAALLGALGLQIGTNLCNDYFDFLKGADTAERLGPTRITQAGLMTPAQVRNAGFAAFGVAMLFGVYLVFRGGWPIVALGLSSILCGVIYTAGPFPLAYVGLGDLFVLIFFGPIAVAGTFYVQALSLSRESFFVGLAPGLISVAILAVNNLRDADLDSKVGKKTLAVRFGKSFARVEYAVSLILAALIPVFLYLHRPSHPWSLSAAAILLFAAVSPLRSILHRKIQGRDLNPLLGKTGQILFWFSLAFSIGWLVS